MTHPKELPTIPNFPSALIALGNNFKILLREWFYKSLSNLDDDANRSMIAAKTLFTARVDWDSRLNTNVVQDLVERLSDWTTAAESVIKQYKESQPQGIESTTLSSADYTSIDEFHRAIEALKQQGFKKGMTYSGSEDGKKVNIFQVLNKGGAR